MNNKYYVRYVLMRYGYQRQSGNDYILSALFSILDDNYSIHELATHLQSGGGFGGNHSWIYKENNRIKISSLMFTRQLSLAEKTFYQFLHDAKIIETKPAQVILWRDEKFNIFIETSNEPPSNKL